MPIKNILVTLYWAMVHSLGTTGLISNATLSDDRLVVLVGPPFVATIFVLLEPLNGFDVGKTTYGNPPLGCMLAIEMHCASKSGTSEASLNTTIQ